MNGHFDTEDFTVTPEGNQVARFVARLYSILENNVTYGDALCWSVDGESILIKSEAEVAEKVLPSNYNHSNFQSFVRQLNAHDFYKVRAGPLLVAPTAAAARPQAFKHPHFRRGQASLLALVKRKRNASAGGRPPQSSSRGGGPRAPHLHPEGGVSAGGSSEQRWSDDDGLEGLEARLAGLREACAAARGRVARCEGHLAKCSEACDEVTAESEGLWALLAEGAPQVVLAARRPAPPPPPPSPTPTIATTRAATSAATMKTKPATHREGPRRPRGSGEVAGKRGGRKRRSKKSNDMDSPLTEMPVSPRSRTAASASETNRPPRASGRKRRKAEVTQVAKTGRSLGLIQHEQDCPSDMIEI